MESNFQTSFIPKKPIVEERTRVKRPVGFFTIVSIFIFIAMVLTLVGSYLYKQVLLKDITSMENTLVLARERFEPERIAELEVLDRRLKASSELLSKHVAVSPIFELISSMTLKTIRFTSFSYARNDANGRVAVRMGGMATGYRSIAIQSDIFSKNNYIIDPVFSNLSLDEKGNVLFELEFYVDQSLVDYKLNLKRNTEDTESSNTPSISEPVPDLNELSQEGVSDATPINTQGATTPSAPQR